MLPPLPHGDQPQPQVKEWIELYDKGVISSPTLYDSPATRAGEGRDVPID